MKRLPMVKMTHFRWLMLAAVLLSAIPLMAACSAKPTSSATMDLSGMKMAAMSDMPAEVQKAPTTVSDAYRFAVANPDALKNVPCFCGCKSAGHTSNYSCYVQETKSDGTIVFDPHALGCTLCVDISQDVMQMTKDGKTPKEIRAAIDKTYSQYGPSNLPDAQ
jgi:hypothetical protein